MDADAFDLAGFCVGVVERDRLIDGTAVRAGDAIVGLAASGLHANGYSLVRALVAQWDLDLLAPVPGAAPSQRSGRTRRPARSGAEPEHALATLGEVLLAPTRIYARAVLGLRAALVEAGHDLRGVAHITGGGLPGNVPRALPPDLGARLDPDRLADAVGHAAVRSARRARRTTSCGRRSTAGSAWSSSSHRTAAEHDDRPARSATASPASVIGEVVPVDELGGAGTCEELLP